MTFTDALAYLDSLVNYEQLPAQTDLRTRRLERMEALLRALGNPHERLRVVHVAGTKGKGSVSAMIYSVLRRCGVPVGLYTSPHLESVRERIRVAPSRGDDDWINEAEFAAGVARLRSAVARTERLGGPVTYFEALTALAFDHFAQQEVRWAVVEVGLGGRLDATNVVRAPVAAITPISLDHTDVLGDSLEAIAAEKAGIIKPGQVVVSAPQAPAVRAFLKERCAVAGAHLVEQGRHVVVESLRLGRDGSTFSVMGRSGAFPHLKLPLLGRHQVENAATAVAVLETVHQLDPHMRLTIEELKGGLAAVEWPGRGELLPSVPPMLLDGAHNRASAERLRELVSDLFPRARVALVVGMSQGKDVEGFIQTLGPLASHVWATQAHHARAMAAEVLATRLRSWVPHVQVAPQVEEALQHAHEAACDLIVVTGSLFVVGEARAHAALITG